MGSAAGPAADVLVVGAGVIGLSIAESLAAEGQRVRVIESDHVGAGASGAAAGMLAPLSEARREGPMLELGLAGLRRLVPLCDRLREDTGVDPELEASGLIQLAMNDAEAAALQARARWLAARLHTALPAASCEWIDREALRRVEPALSSESRGALRVSLECHLRPPLLLRALEKSALARGVRIESGVRGATLCREGARIVGVQSSAGRFEAGAVVVAAGPWSPGLLEASGVALAGAAGLPIEPVRGQILSLEGPLPRTREIVWGEGVYCVPKRDGSWIVGATEEHVGFDRRVTAGGIAWLLGRACAVFPSLENATFGSAWAGLRPVAREGLPWIGGVAEWPGLYLAAGHGRNGVLLSAITAERIRDEILGKWVVPSDDPFHPSSKVRAASRPGAPRPSFPQSR